MEPHARPVADQQEDAAVERIEGHAEHERPAVAQDGALPENYEDRDHGQADEPRCHAGASRLRELLNDLGRTEPENEAPLAAGESDGGVDEREPGDPVEPLAAVAAPAFQGLARLSGRAGARWLDDRTGASHVHGRSERLRRTAERTRLHGGPPVTGGVTLNVSALAGARLRRPRN